MSGQRPRSERGHLEADLHPSQGEGQESPGNRTLVLKLEEQDSEPGTL